MNAFSSTPWRRNDPRIILVLDSTTSKMLGSEDGNNDGNKDGSNLTGGKKIRTVLGQRDITARKIDPKLMQ